jgi:AcrR family transcriptional regulator
VATQEERRDAARAALLASARRLFGKRGYAETTIDEVAADAGFAKGGVYHHFPTKTDLFEAVLELVSEDVARQTLAVASAQKNVLDALIAGTRAYFDCCAEARTARILLVDGPQVLGWDRWREIDQKHFGGGVAAAIAAAMEQGLIAGATAETVTRLLLGAITEAALDCAARSDFDKLAGDYLVGFEALLTGLALKAREKKGRRSA